MGGFTKGSSLIAFNQNPFRFQERRSRRVYRCGFTDLDGVTWIEWSSSALGLKHEDRTYPVFVQRHALRTYLDRVGQVFCGDQLEGRLQDALALSLIDPEIRQRADGTFLAEYHLSKYKLGYVVARKLDDLILIETFLFLTMDGTPEGIELKKQWKLERAGKEFTDSTISPRFCLRMWRAIPI